MSDATDIHAITEIVHIYFDGMRRGDTHLLLSVFHPDACLFGFENGKFCRASLSEWMDEVRGMRSPESIGEVMDMRIVSIDQTVDIAIVKDSVLYAGLRFTDYLTLMVIDGAWKIVHKTYRHE
jgi:hypothetical protein